jgi:quinoprotein relay system zinc metallohydrolase 2
MPRTSRRTILKGAAATALAAPIGFVHAAPGPDMPAIEIANGIFVLQGRHELASASNGGHIANLAFVIGSEAIAVIDTGGSARNGRALLAAIRRISDRPIRHVVNTHMHPDHLLGNVAFEAPGTVFTGHAKLPRALAARAERYLMTNRDELGPDAFDGTRVVPPSNLVIGGRTLTLTARKTAHTDNDLTVRDEATGTLFLGDLLFSQRVPTLDGSIRGWLEVLSQLRQEPAERVVPGHGPPSMAWPQAMAAEQGYLERIVADCRALIKSGRTLEDALASAGQTEKDAWLLFGEFHPRNVSAAFAELEWE